MTFKMRNLPVSFSLKCSDQQGFSLIEMAVVLVIIGVVMGVSLPVMTSQTQRAMNVRTRDHAASIQQALHS